MSDTIEADPEAFGFTRPLDASSLNAPGASPTYPGLLFFDPIHPTTAAHRLIAETEIAEPPVIMLLGAGLIGPTALRRHRG